MGSFSMMHWMVLLVIVLILFGAGRLPRVMGDFAKGIKAFKSGMQEEESATAAPPPPAAGVAPPYPAQPAAVQPPVAAPPGSPQTVAPPPGTVHAGTDYRTGSAA